MTIATRFSHGDTVVNTKTGKVFKVGEIRVRRWTYKGEEILTIEYRSFDVSTGATGTWVHEVNVR